LKHGDGILLYISKSVAEELPLKQGLKHLKYDFFVFYVFVAEELPLKQGLKLILFSVSAYCYTVLQRNFH